MSIARAWVGPRIWSPGVASYTPASTVKAYPAELIGSAYYNQSFHSRGYGILDELEANYAAMVANGGGGVFPHGNSSNPIPNIHKQILVGVCRQAYHVPLYDYEYNYTDMYRFGVVPDTGQVNGRVTASWLSANNFLVSQLGTLSLVVRERVYTASDNDAWIGTSTIASVVVDFTADGNAVLNFTLTSDAYVGIIAVEGTLTNPDFTSGSSQGRHPELNLDSMYFEFQ